MPNIYRTNLLILLFMFIAACAPAVPSTPQSTPTSSPSALPAPQIARHPGPDNYSTMNTYFELADFDPNVPETWQLDLRCSNLTKLDLSQSGEDLLYADFDSKTQWPPAEQMPAGFDWQKIMEVSKDPGLGLRVLHTQGITGKNIGIAIIDQTLLVDHIEYIDQLQLYEEPENRDRGKWSSMHGPAVASIAVGKTVGVAPEADLYFLAAPSCFYNNDFGCLARSVRRIIEVNRALPSDRKIRALSIARGGRPEDKGYADFLASIREATAEGIFVISSDLSETHGLSFHGLGRNSLSDPNQFESYGPGLWWREDFYEQGIQAGTLLVPMDSRTTASPTGAEDYVFYHEGGWSWSIPYLAGMYILAAQVKSEITPDEFWATALDTGRTIQIRRDGQDHAFGIILDPQALIETLKSK